jgi:hypothetical protein
LRCGFQKLEGQATSEGLWLESTVSRVAANCVWWPWRQGAVLAAQVNAR